MESGHNRDPGNLSPEDELALLELDKVFRNTHAKEMIPSRAKEWTFYLMAHTPPGSTDIESPDYDPNYYMFIVQAPERERVKDKVFLLFLDETTGNYVRIVDTAGLKAQYEAQGLSEDDLLVRPEFVQEFWDSVEAQGQLGSAVPNSEDMEDFGDIVSSWQHHENPGSA